MSSITTAIEHGQAPGRKTPLDASGPRRAKERPNYEGGFGARILGALLLRYANRRE